MQKLVLMVTMVMVLGMATLAQADLTNLALGGIATQSSTTSWDDSGPAVASRAIDGNTDGNFYNHSVTHTNYEKAWWQVDLQNTYKISDIVIWNRTDNDCGGRLSNFYVEVLDKNQNIMWKQDYFTNGGYPNPNLFINLPNNTIGEVVKVGLNGTNWLHLAEVEVHGSSSTVPIPGALLLFGPGLAGLGLLRKRLTN
jgi:hypothetical protein